MISRRDGEEERGLFTGTGDQVPLALGKDLGFWAMRTIIASKIVAIM
jgi:hypothetical protein